MLNSTAMTWGWAEICGWEGKWVFNCLKIVLCLKLDGGRGDTWIFVILYTFPCI